MLRVGVAIEETWDFLNEIYEDFTKNYQTSLFKRRTCNFPLFNIRINRYMFYRDMQIFMKTHDVVFFEWASELLTTATQLRKTCGIVTRLHRYEMYQWADRINWDSVDKIILVSKAKQKEFISRFPELSPKTEVIYEAVSLKRFQLEPKPFAGDIGILCHLTPRKRVYDLVLAFYELLQKNNDFHLHVAGGKHPAHGDYYQALQHIVQELNLQEQVTFYGHNPDPSNWYSQIDIFISNSYSEGLQVAPMEAMASGCYCLSHRWDGAAELLPEENLYYSSTEMQEKILQFADSSDIFKSEQKAFMREIVCEKFNIENTKRQIRSVIDEVGGNVK